MGSVAIAELRPSWLSWGMRVVDTGLRVRSRKRWRLVSCSRHALPVALNHVDRQFVSDRANRHWVTDMTCVRTAQGWLYLAVVGRCTTACSRPW